MLAQDDSAPRRRDVNPNGLWVQRPTPHHDLIRFFARIAIGIVRWEPYAAGLLRNGVELLCATGAQRLPGLPIPY
jgi:hypothetical protein